MDLNRIRISTHALERLVQRFRSHVEASDSTGVAYWRHTGDVRHLEDAARDLLLRSEERRNIALDTALMIELGEKFGWGRTDYRVLGEMLFVLKEDPRTQADNVVTIVRLSGGYLGRLDASTNARARQNRRERYEVRTPAFA